MVNKSTEILLKQASNGDNSAVNELMTIHSDWLSGFIARRLCQKIRRRVGVEDILQDVLIEASRRLDQYLTNPTLPFRAWIYQIACDRVIDAYRRHRVSAKRSVDHESYRISDGECEFCPTTTLIDTQPTPADSILNKEVVCGVREAITKLNSQDSQIIVMRHYENLSNQEVGRVLGLSEPAASMRYMRAIRRLKVICK